MPTDDDLLAGLVPTNAAAEARPPHPARLLGSTTSRSRTVVIAPSVVDALVHDTVTALDHLLWGHRTAPTAASPTSDTGEAAA